MEPTKELIDALYWERVERARRMSPEEKVLAGLEMFDLTSEIMADGVRARHPNADNARVQQILREQLAVIRRVEENL